MNFLVPAVDRRITQHQRSLLYVSRGHCVQTLTHPLAGIEVRWKSSGCVECRRDLVCFTIGAQGVSVFYSEKEKNSFTCRAGYPSMTTTSPDYCRKSSTVSIRCPHASQSEEDSLFNGCSLLTRHNGLRYRRSNRDGSVSSCQVTLATAMTRYVTAADSGLPD